MRDFKLVATGGTFDMIHRGHLALLEKSFELSENVIIGLTSDELAIKKGKKISNNYSYRLEKLENKIKENFPNAKYEISKLENDFGPAVLEGNVEALIVSEETSPQGKVLNDLRQEKGFSKVEIVVVPMILAKDGKRISTTRIKNSEIDEQGNLN